MQVTLWVPSDWSTRGGGAARCSAGRSASPAYGVTGTHLQPGWDGDWSAFHIHHNTRRWWGTDAQWAQVETSYRRLCDFVEATWGPQS